MKSLNKVMLIGNLGRDPELRSTPGGLQVANFTLATSDSFNDRSGNRQERTEWHRIVLFGKLAEIGAQYLTKGQRVYIEGRLQTREWEDKQGQKRQTTEVVASDMVMLGGRGEGRGEGRSEGRSEARGAQADEGAGGYAYREADAVEAQPAAHEASGYGGFKGDQTMEPIQEDDDLPF